MRHSGTAAIVGKIMAKAQASRGDVSKGTSENKVLQQMLAQMSSIKPAATDTSYGSILI